MDEDEAHEEHLREAHEAYDELERELREAREELEDRGGSLDSEPDIDKHRDSIPEVRQEVAEHVESMSRD